MNLVFIDFIQCKCPELKISTLKYLPKLDVGICILLKILRLPTVSKKIHRSGISLICTGLESSGIFSPNFPELNFE